MDSKKSLESEPDYDLDADNLPYLPWEDLESHNKRLSREAGKKFEILAESLAEGGCRTQAEVRKMATKLGILQRQVNRWKINRYVMRRTAEILQARALYAVAYALDGQAELAREDTGAFKALAQVAKVLDPGGVRVQTNVNVDKRQLGDTYSNAKFIERFKDGLKHGLYKRLALVPGAVQDVTIDEEIERDIAESEQS